MREESSYPANDFIHERERENEKNRFQMKMNGKCDLKAFVTTEFIFAKFGEFFRKQSGN
jgi:hypothetical protein